MFGVVVYFNVVILHLLFPILLLVVDDVDDVDDVVDVLLLLVLLL